MFLTRWDASAKRDLRLENLLVCTVFLLSCSDILVLLIASGILVVTKGMFHRESYRKKLFLAVYLTRVFDFLKFKGKSLLPILTLQRGGKKKTPNDQLNARQRLHCTQSLA